MKKAVIIFALSTAVVLATASSAFANFGPHGAYSLDTDACAGCHRAHTSFSTLTWTAQPSVGQPYERSALLVSSASSMTEFCYACHGDLAPGASTNVEAGLFDAGPSGSLGVPQSGAIMYRTNSSFMATLNAGAFDGATSMHDMDQGAVTDPMWGDGDSAPTGTNLKCTSCHDVHGSSNYRLLKDYVNGNKVGGYDGDTPQPTVISNEQGYPYSVGWLKHEPGAAQMAGYRPNYTSPEYGIYLPGRFDEEDPRFVSMSTWCAGCHETYDQQTSSYNYGAYESNGTPRRLTSGELTVTGATAFVGARGRHRHPVNRPVMGANTTAGFGTNAVTSTVLPLEKRPAALGTERGSWQLADYMGCLTCHRAHGTSAVMTGWANARLVNLPSATVTWSVEPTTSTPATAGVNPNFTSALLRTDNRGVCQRCHNK